MPRQLRYRLPGVPQHVVVALAGPSARDTSASMKYNFLYSKKNGLIGFEVIRDKKSGMFLSIIPKGYGD